jgi:hypothetical protein
VPDKFGDDRGIARTPIDEKILNSQDLYNVIPPLTEEEEEALDEWCIHCGSKRCVGTCYQSNMTELEY